MTVLYISGPMAGYPNLNRASFNEAENMLRRAGFDTLNPLNNGLAEGLPWDAYLRADLKMVCDATALALLPGWEASRGARLEVATAHALGMTSLPLSVWLGYSS
jgi:hypothetical protein